ncbi:MAG: histidine triad nucleotide-binding protein [Selenomonadaceae bacterium]|nr:histidine triad nucleotide-binding protein [Selenomonadaceae bacterium]
MEDCIFCKIAKKEIESNLVYEDDMVVAFRDLSPQAPEHVLIVPKKHIASINDFTKDDVGLMGHIMVEVLPEVAKSLNIAEGGYRVVINTGEDAQQTVKHLHVHLLGGRKMTWPPG